MFMFESYQMVPSNVIKQIGNAIFEAYVKDLHLADEMLDYIKIIFNHAVKEVASNATPSVDGYKLNNKQVEAVASHLANGKRISAIREFRSATGCDIKKAKDIIDRFGTGLGAYKSFRYAFSGPGICL